MYERLLTTAHALDRSHLGSVLKVHGEEGQWVIDSVMHEFDSVQVGQFTSSGGVVRVHLPLYASVEVHRNPDTSLVGTLRESPSPGRIIS